MAATITLPPGFSIEPQDNRLRNQPAVGDHPEATPFTDPTTPPPLGVLSNFTGVFAGRGFNTIFRPFSGTGSDNVLELNLTSEALSFNGTVGNTPNRGLNPQQDIFLNGVPYIQVVSDVTNTTTGLPTAKASQIHFEPGLWMHVPATTDPNQTESLVRMASIPHGTTINAQALNPIITVASGPRIDPVDITPFQINQPTSLVPFPSQDTTTVQQFRLPPDLSPFVKAGTITAAILKDPNTVIRNDNVGKTFVQTIVFTVSTDPTVAGEGGGTANIAFLVGAPAGQVGATSTGPNANAISMAATFWISTLSHVITVPARAAADPPTRIPAPEPHPGALVPTFVVSGVAVAKPIQVTVQSKQIQYTQKVLLNFAPLTWPHVSCATLLPQADIPVPASAFPK